MQDARFWCQITTSLAQHMQTCKQMPRVVSLLDGVLYLMAAAQQKVHWLLGERPSGGTRQLGRSGQQELLQ